MATKTSATSLIITLPRDDVNSHIPLSGSKRPKLGLGLIFEPKTQRIRRTVAGLLHRNPQSDNYFIRCNKRRYLPTVSDRVIGIVEERMGDYCKVNIFDPQPAVLHQLFFDGATRRSRPNLSPGALVYCRVVDVNLDMDPEVTCHVEGTESLERRDWMTDDAMYGELKGGLNFRIRLGLSRQLSRPTNVVLNALGSEGVKFEVCIGVNGVLWAHSEIEKNTVIICNAIRNSEVMTGQQVRGMVKDLINAIATTN